MIMLFFVRPGAERRSVLPSLLFPDKQEHDDGGDQKQRQKRKNNAENEEQCAPETDAEPV